MSRKPVGTAQQIYSLDTLQIIKLMLILLYTWRTKQQLSFTIKIKNTLKEKTFAGRNFVNVSTVVKASHHRDKFSRAKEIPV